jgi:hypothetical protein
MAPTLAQLLTPQTQQQIFQLLLAYYQAAGYPTTAWPQFGNDVARNQAFAQALFDVLTNYIPAIAGGSLLDYAPNYPGWTQLTASEIFGLPVNLATFTQGYILATNTSSTAYNFSPTNQLIATFQASTNRYLSQGTGTIPANSTLLILFQAEFAGASYVDPSNANPSNSLPTALTLVTPLPGVWLNNPSTNFSSVTHVGNGTGSLTLGGSPVGSHSIEIDVTATSTSAPASLSYKLDGAAAVSLGSVSSVTNLAGLGINITLVNGASGTSWVNQDTYSFSTPASWISSQGANIEADPALAARSRARWASLSPIPTMNLYALLAQSTPNVGAQVTQVFVVPDPNINNKVNVVVAGPGGILPGPTITLIQNFLTPFRRGTDNPVVSSPTTLGITIAATIYGAASQAAAIQAAATTAYNNYVASIAVNGTIKLSDIEVLTKPNPLTGLGGIQGVSDIQNLTINGAATNLILGGPGSFVLPAYPPTLNLSYIFQ